MVLASPILLTHARTHTYLNSCMCVGVRIRAHTHNYPFYVIYVLKQLDALPMQR